MGTNYESGYSAGHEALIAQNFFHFFFIFYKKFWSTKRLLNTFVQLSKQIFRMIQLRIFEKEYTQVWL